MNIYIDESGSINNTNTENNPYFIIALVHIKNSKALRKAFKRFISSNKENLMQLDHDRIQNGRVVRSGHQMFNQNGGFIELKGNMFDPNMKKKFVSFFSEKQHFDLYFIKIHNSRLTDSCCKNKARVFNYVLKIALEYYIRNGLLPRENCCLQLDERNERTASKAFLEQYLNTELIMENATENSFSVTYFDSANNHFIQIADVFANLFYSQLLTGNYSQEIQTLKERGILKHIFEFPLS